VRAPTILKHKTLQEMHNEPNARRRSRYVMDTTEICFEGINKRGRRNGCLRRFVRDAQSQDVSIAKSTLSWPCSCITPHAGFIYNSSAYPVIVCYLDEIEKLVGVNECRIAVEGALR
jgi:hypothetical protein